MNTGHPKVFTSTIYNDNGYANRKAYLKSVAKRFGVKFSIVEMLSDVLGASEDFDGLICEVEDYKDSGGMF